MRIAAACALLLPLFSGAAFGQDEPNKARSAVIDPAQADGDFIYQGEFAGWRWDSCRGWVWSGLQVVALGDGKFAAALLDGGLPGNGWNRTPPEKFEGQRAGELVELRGLRHSLGIRPNSASLSDETGRDRGQLVRMLRTSPTLGAPPPPGATVLFPAEQLSQTKMTDGQVEDLSYLSGAKLAADGTLLAGVLTKMPVGAFYMHLEFRTPYMPHARGQGRGNSGVYIQQRYEVQILDSFGLAGLDNECGGLYKQARPDTNLCLPPLAWQTYDIWFTPPHFATDGQTKLANGVVTVLHNGAPIHWYRQLTAKTGGGKQEGPEPFPINLQNHGNPVTFRNIWLVSGDGQSAVTTMPQPPPLSRSPYRRGIFRGRG